MTNFNGRLIFLSFAFLLTACETMSIREMTADEENIAKQEQNKTADSIGTDYPDLPENHLRMYVFTAYEDLEEEEAERDGYYIDFKVKPQTTPSTHTKIKE